MLLKQTGEFGLIKQIRKITPQGRGVILGIGDDAAVLKVNSKKNLIFTTDMLIEGKHFRLKEATPFEIGWKAMAVNLSDIAAMGGRPTYAVVGVGLPGKLSVAFVKEMYRGIRTLAKNFGVSVVGGDTNASDKLIVSVSLLGEVPPKAFVTRRGAVVGDVVFVTGSLGGSYRSCKHLRFIPRLKESEFLMKRFKPHAMIDLSDGLASDLRRLAEESKTGFLVAEEAIPVSEKARRRQDALSEGEDFELLFTLSPKDAARLTAMPPQKGLAPFCPIGKVVPAKYGICLVARSGRCAPMAARGFEHFK